MILRKATIAEVPALVAMGRRFRAETAYRDLIAESVPQLTAMATRLVEGPQSVVLVAEADGALGGMIGLVVFAHHLSAERIAGEVMWWVDPDARGVGRRLLGAAERWAAEAGAEAIHLIAPAAGDARIGALYTRRGYQPFETAYQRRVTPALTALQVVDDVLPDPAAYRQAALQSAFGPIETSPGVVFPGLALEPPPTLVHWIQTHYPQLTLTRSFLRHSPAGQLEPNFIHTDRDMGQVTAIYYLTADPPPEDGTTFWRHVPTGAIQSTATTEVEFLDEWMAWRDRAQWVPWHTVPARPNRLVLFPASYFHSRAIEANYGAGETARLIQVVFGTGTLGPAGGV